MKRLLLLFSLLFFLTHSQSQNTESNSKDTYFWKNVRIGGGLNLSFGNNYTLVGVSPSAIYDVSDEFSTGLGISYQYADNKRSNYRANFYGASFLNFYRPIYGLELSSIFEYTYANYSFKLTNEERKEWVPALYLGAAYRAGNNISIGLQFDVLYDEDKSIYSSAISPIFRFYF